VLHKMRKRKIFQVHVCLPLTSLFTDLGHVVFLSVILGQYIKMYSNIYKMQLYTVYLYLETALHVSGGTPTHHQERIQLYLQHLVFVTPLLLPV